MTQKKMPTRLFLVCTVVLCIFGSLSAAQDDANQLLKVGKQLQKSIVLIAITDQSGREVSVGTGFVVEKPNLIATNLHVIGEGRSFIVKDSTGKQIEVEEVVASDRYFDLAVLKLKTSKLSPLRLADFEKVEKGQPFVAIGHPQGLRDSVVQGVISSKRKIDGRTMLQVAMPVESGNSGGPVANKQGEVVGIVTLKSLATNNIGFAIGSDQIKKLLAQPNPVSLSKWLKIGVLRSDIWQPKFGASWRLKGGRILAHSTGDGFGGRSICIYQKPLPELPFEMEVEVKLDDESGAAGLAFLVDGKDKHYGFYPSNSRLRFSRFEGSTPYQWTVLDEQLSSSYKPERWNRLKVRVEKQKVVCFVNDSKVGEYKDRKINGQRIGLAKFRDTRAEFRNFRVGKSLPTNKLEFAKRDALSKQLDAKLNNELYESILKNSNGIPEQSREVIRDKVSELEEKISRLRDLSAAVHVDFVKSNFAKVINKKNDADIDLIDACLWIAKLDEPDLEIKGYRGYFDDLAEQLLALSKQPPTNPNNKSEGKSTKKDAPPIKVDKIKLLNEFLFKTNGYHGSRHDYYRKENSYISSVLEDREGIPITLSILYIELGRRLGLSLDGIGLPGHFVVSQNRKGQSPQLVDVFANGKKISKEDAKFIVASTTTRNWDENFLSPVSKRQILFRVLLNLRSIAERKDDRDAILRYLELMFLLEPDDVAIKGTRALLLFQKGFQQKAINELDQIIEKRPTGLNLRMLQNMRRRLVEEMNRNGQPKNSN